MSQYRCTACDRDLDDDTTPMAGDGVCEDCVDEFTAKIVELADATIAQRTCKNCRHWDSKSASKAWGHCASVGVDDTAPINIVSPADFGCNRFEGKE